MNFLCLGLFQVCIFLQGFSVGVLNRLNGLAHKQFELNLISSWVELVLIINKTTCARILRLIAWVVFG